MHSVALTIWFSLILSLYSLYGCRLIVGHAFLYSDPRVVETPTVKEKRMVKDEKDADGRAPYIIKT